MAEFDNTNRGAIWKNERKTEEKHPDFTGTLNVEGVEYFFDAWKRKPDANPKAPPLSFKIKRKGAQQNKVVSAPPSDFDESIPF